jgi:serine/threonine-protein kinase TNNI3K
MAAVNSSFWPADGSGFTTTSYFANSSCSGAPLYIVAEVNGSCTSQSATSTCDTEYSDSGIISSTSCELNLTEYLNTRALSGQYLVRDAFDGEGCSDGNYSGWTALYQASGDCIPMWSTVSITNDGIALFTRYDNNSCVTLSYYSDTITISKDDLSDHSCISTSTIRRSLYDRFYQLTFASDEASGSSSGANASQTGSEATISTPAPSTSTQEAAATFTTGAIVGSIAGSMALLVGLLLALRWCFSRRTRKREALDQSGGGRPNAGDPSVSTTKQTTASEDTEASAANTDKMWEDPVIVLSRVPREKVIMGPLVSSGGYGNVYRGSFNGKPVAIKMLLESSQQDVKCVNAFLCEVKLMATFKHECIIRFVGTAWDSLNDLCVLSEFMAGGDLRSLLNTYRGSGHPVGFDRSKLGIAYQVSFALTYLHSLSPPILHRDLKSRNVLLSEDHSEAKLTDFGVSRQHAGGTMTAGIGTLLWMAPEVMAGEQYDEKADVFSFGVLLAEIDTHELPYAHARGGRDSDAKGPRMTDPTLVPKIASGVLQVQFSTVDPTPVTAAVVELGMQCVELVPSDRPTAAEVLYRLQRALKELGDR